MHRICIFLMVISFCFESFGESIPLDLQPGEWFSLKYTGSNEGGHHGSRPWEKCEVDVFISRRADSTTLVRAKGIFYNLYRDGRDIEFRKSSYKPERLYKFFFENSTYYELAVGSRPEEVRLHHYKQADDSYRFYELGWNAFADHSGAHDHFIRCYDLVLESSERGIRN